MIGRQRLLIEHVNRSFPQSFDLSAFHSVATRLKIE
jgi:long-subunit fatty acid transport protein